MHKGVKQGVNPLKWVQIRAKRAQEGMKKAREIGLFWMVAAIRAQEFGNARPVDAKRDPEQEHRRAAEHSRRLQPVFLYESAKGHFHTSLLIRPGHKKRRPVIRIQYHTRGKNPTGSLSESFPVLIPAL